MRDAPTLTTTPTPYHTPTPLDRSRQYLLRSEITYPNEPHTHIPKRRCRPSIHKPCPKTIPLGPQKSPTD
ncbi:hypothetical protein CHS0354_041561, partial [Potamilus streckersoni]